MTDKTVYLAGVVVTNGKVKFHTSGSASKDAAFTQMHVPLFNDAASIGAFAVVTFKDPVTKLEAAQQLLSNEKLVRGFQNYSVEVENALNEQIAKRTPAVKVAKTEKKAASKAAAVAAFKDVADPVEKKGTPERLELLRKVAAKRAKK
jgi:hypothetical protein